jgi:hypothetical protein
MAAPTCKEADMLDLSRLSARERLVAEQAVLLQRELDRVADAAPHGKGFECLEAAITDVGFGFLRQRLSDSISARDEVQKRGSASAPAPAGAGRSSKPPTRATS